MSEDLQKMYAYQQIMRKYGGESICHSAILRCGYGSQEYVLNLTRSHGKYVGQNAQIDIKDGKEAYFGHCRKINGPCRAKLTDWYNGNENDRMFDERTMSMEASVQKDTGFMICLAE